MDYILLLEHPNRSPLAADLGELIPPGFLVTAQAYRTLLETGGLTDRIARRLAGLRPRDRAAVTAASADVAGWVRNAPVPAPIQAAVVAAYRQLGSRPPVSVRSSATADGLPSAAYGGQQESFLHIYGEDAVMQHVRQCWASLWTPRAVAYRAAMGFDHLKADLAVVVQAMLQPAETGDDWDPEIHWLLLWVG